MLMQLLSCSTVLLLQVAAAQPHVIPPPGFMSGFLGSLFGNSPGVHPIIKEEELPGFGHGPIIIEEERPAFSPRFFGDGVVSVNGPPPRNIPPQIMGLPPRGTRGLRGRIAFRTPQGMMFPVAMTTRGPLPFMPYGRPSHRGNSIFDLLDEGKSRLDEEEEEIARETSREEYLLNDQQGSQGLAEFERVEFSKYKILH